MQLFTRSVLMTGAPAEYIGYASTMCSYVSDKLGREVSLWSTVFGAPAGTMTYSVRVEGVADLRASTAKLLDDGGYHAKIAEGQSMVAAPSVDALAVPIHGELGDPPPVGAVGMVTQATMALGSYADAVAWSVGIAQHVEKVAGVPTMFLTSTYGGFGDCAWIGVVADDAAADAATAAINGDAEYISMIDGAKGLFIDGSGQQSLITRIA